MNPEWFGRRWLEFRNGYATYMVFLFGFSNFVLILYNFVPEFKEYVELPYFAVIVVLMIIPAGIIIGRKHHDKQVPVESKVMTVHNPFVYEIVPKSKDEIVYRMLLFQLKVLKKIPQDHELDPEFEEWEKILEKFLKGTTTKDLF